MGDNPNRVTNLVSKMAAPDGYIERLIIDAEGNVLEGQHRLQALRQMNVGNVPVSVIKDRSDMVAAVQALGLRPEQARQVADETLRMVRKSGSPQAARSEYDLPAGWEHYFDAALKKYGIAGLTALGAGGGYASSQDLQSTAGKPVPAGTAIY